MKPRSPSRLSLWPVLLAAALVALTDVSPAAESPTGFRFLTIGGGARAVGLGETMVADDGDPFVIEYNPAGLADAGRFAVVFAHNAFYLDTRGEYAAAVVPVGAWAIGARVGYMGTSDIPRRVGPSEDPLGYYSATDAIVQLAVARPIDDHLAIGFSAAYVAEHIDLETAQGFVLGIGLRYRLHRNISLGAAFLNVGPPVAFVDREFRMPNQVRFGGRWQIGRASTRCELAAADNDNVKWHLGGEYALDPRLVLRGGLRLGYETQAFNAGFGVRTPDQRFGVDYAYAPYSDDLGATHRFGLTIRP